MPKNLPSLISKQKNTMKKFRLLIAMFLCAGFCLSLDARRFPDRSGRLADMRQRVWTAWCDELLQHLPVSPLDFAPLGEGRTAAWTLPDSLEPHAVMNFRSGTKGVRPAEGWPCFLYLHGSGPRDSEWETGWRLAQRFDDAPSAYVIPQIPNEGKWYRWWQRSKLWAWNHLLRMLLARPDVDASRLYLFGISEGAYGSQRMASYYADYFAAAGPMAGGEPLKNAPVENLGNLAFSFLTGSEDVMFYRNILTQNTAKALDSIASLYPGAYHHRVEIIPGRGHHIDYSPTTPWLARHRRTAQPRHFLWENFEVDSLKRNAFYNLQVLSETDAYRTSYEFMADADNVITLSVKTVEYATTFTDPWWDIDMFFDRTYAPAAHGRLRVFLSEELVDLERPVTVMVNGHRLFHGRLKPSHEVMLQSARLWGDPLRLFPAAVEVEW